MKETFLRGDKLESYLPMGENGQAVHLSALQLRETLRLRQLSEVADSLAIPQVNEQGDRIDWYAGFSGNVVPWSAATHDERQSALRQLEANQAAIEQLSAQMINQKAHEMRLFGALLSKTVQFPDQDHVYLVDGKPVVTFWGFVSAKQQARPNPLDCLRSSRPVTPPIASVVPSEPAASVASISSPAPTPERTQRRRLPRWLWLLLPLLLILFALLLLRGCVPDIYIWGLTSSTHSAPSHQNEALSVSDHHSLLPVNGKPSVNETVFIHELTSVNGKESANGMVPLHGATSGKTDSTKTDNTKTDGTTQLNSFLEQEMETDATSLAKNASSEASTAEAMNSSKPTPPVTDALSNSSSTNSSSTPSQPAVNIPPVLATVPSSGDLKIPAAAVQQGAIDFLNGYWHAGAGIQDSRTGKPLSLTYQIQDGKGQIEMVRGDGIRCQALVKAAMSSGMLQLDNSGEAKCTDGSTYTMPDVICRPGKQDVAECKGRYDEKTLFPMSMKREEN
ncbi:SrfA family protein [Xenorhabdus lircayensis]